MKSTSKSGTIAQAGTLYSEPFTVNSEIFARVYLTCAKFRENKTLAKKRNQAVVY